VIGVVDGEALLTGPAGHPIVSFVLSDDQHALTDGGLVVRAQLGWCQVICRSAGTAEVAGSLRPGSEVRVRGELSILRAAPVSRESDAVLVSLIAECLQVLAPPGTSGGARPSFSG